jgi:hypothetical protein
VDFIYDAYHLPAVMIICDLSVVVVVVSTYRLRSTWMWMCARLHRAICGVPWLLIDLKGSGVNDLDRVWGLIYLPSSHERKDVSATHSPKRQHDVRPRGVS